MLVALREQGQRREEAALLDAVAERVESSSQSDVSIAKFSLNLLGDFALWICFLETIDARASIIEEEARAILPAGDFQERCEPEIVQEIAESNQELAVRRLSQAPEAPNIATVVQKALRDLPDLVQLQVVEFLEKPHYAAVSAGRMHSVLLRSDDQAVACGWDRYGQCSIPLGSGGFKQVAAGGGHTVLLRNDGTVVTDGYNANGQCNTPILPAGLHYTDVSAGDQFTVALRSDGRAVFCGNCNKAWNMQLELDMYAGAHDTRYVGAASGGDIIVLLCSDGKAVAFGDEDDGACFLPELPRGRRYISAAVGCRHTVLIRDDGVAFAQGQDSCGQCEIPKPPAGVRYTQAGAGAQHTVLLRSDGQAVAFGHRDEGQCDVPALPSGLWYTGVAAGFGHTLLLRNDGEVVSFGIELFGRCEVPPLPKGLRYIYNST